MLSNREESFKTDRLLNSYLSQVCRKPKTEKLCLSCVFFCVLSLIRSQTVTHIRQARTHRGGKSCLTLITAKLFIGCASPDLCQKTFSHSRFFLESAVITKKRLRQPVQFSAIRSSNQTSNSICNNLQKRKNR